MTDPAPMHGLWADLARPDISPAEADFSVIGIPFDGLASARKGAALAPDRIRFWSQHLTVQRGPDAAGRANHLRSGRHPHLSHHSRL
jgi:arginase family enzyme